MSRATVIVANSLAVPFNRLEQIARALVYVRALPMAVGRNVPNIDAVQLLLLVAAAVFADRFADAPAVAAAFPGLPERSGGRSGAATFGAFFAGLMADARDDRIEIELIKAIDVRQQTQYLARVNINDALTFAFGEPLPARIVRELVCKITPRAFDQLRRDFNSAEPVLAQEFNRWN